MHRRRFAVIVVAYAIKDSPNWVLPVLTSAIIDTVVQHRPFPQLVLSPAPSLFDYDYEHFEVVGYQHHPGIKAPVAV